LQKVYVTIVCWIISSVSGATGSGFFHLLGRAIDPDGQTPDRNLDIASKAVFGPGGKNRNLNQYKVDSSLKRLFFCYLNSFVKTGLSPGHQV